MTTTTTQPVPPNAQILDDMDAALAGLIAMAAFGPCEQGTATSAEQVSTAELLLFRLKLARRGVAEMRQALKLPARQVPLTHARVFDDTASVPGGLGPNPSVAAEKERAPRSAVAIRSAARGSTGAVVADGAGANVPARRRPAEATSPSAAAGRCDGPGREGRAVGADGAATFANPNSRVPLQFEEGTDHLIGAARPALIPQLVGDAVYDAQRRRQLSNP